MAEDTTEQTPEDKKAGWPGCIKSMDVTHILLGKVKYRLRESHLGFKSSDTATSEGVEC